MATTSNNVIEEHFTVGEIAEKWKLSTDMVQRIFQDEPGVLKLGHPSRLVGRSLQRRYFTLRIPESVFLRVQNRLMHKRDVESVALPARRRAPRRQKNGSDPLGVNCGGRQGRLPLYNTLLAWLNAGAPDDDAAAVAKPVSAATTSPSSTVSETPLRASIPP